MYQCSIDAEGPNRNDPTRLTFIIESTRAKIRLRRLCSHAFLGRIIISQKFIIITLVVDDDEDEDQGAKVRPKPANQ